MKPGRALIPDEQLSIYVLVFTTKPSCYVKLDDAVDADDADDGRTPMR